MLVRFKQRQRGFTLLELMIGLAVGLIVVSGVLVVYLSTVESSGSTLKSSRLNQEMSALINIMSNDMRRAGFWGTPDFTTPESNPFSIVDTATPANTTALAVHALTGAVWNDTTYAATLGDRNGRCITYSYDANQDGSVDNNERLGFRWSGLATDPIEMRTSTSGGTNLCNDAGNDSWEPITDPDTMTITNLSFALYIDDTPTNDLSNDSRCLNTNEPNGVDDGGDSGVVDDTQEYDCYAVIPPVNSGYRTVESRLVTITLTAALASDSNVRATMTQMVQVRNNLVRRR